MSNLSQFHQEIIEFHNDYPVSFLKKEADESTIEAYNPLCGDQYFLSIVVNDGNFEQVSFHGHGCALSKASTSILMKYLRDSTVEDFRMIYESFQQMLLSPEDKEMPESLPEDLHAFEGVRRNPSRHPCATLSWSALYDKLAK
jgi:nitrogen fixation NifU-like protein